MTADNTIHEQTNCPLINSVSSHSDYQKANDKNQTTQESNITHESIQTILYPLLYSAILENVNTQLEAELTSPLDSLYEDENTQNPELFSELMLGQIINLYNTFSEKHPELCESVILDQFLNTITEGINNGIADTKEILDHNYSLENAINTQIEQINDKLYEGLEQYCYTFGYNDGDTEEKDSLCSDPEGNTILSEELLDRLRM